MQSCQAADALRLTVALIGGAFQDSNLEAALPDCRIHFYSVPGEGN